MECMLENCHNMAEVCVTCLGNEVVSTLRKELVEATAERRVLNNIICGNCTHDGMIKTADYCNACEGGSMFSNRLTAEHNRYRDALEEIKKDSPACPHTQWLTRKALEAK